ncbi:MAG: 4-hydroxybenzoate 3-monooxygenase [Betaproteobacteria bacterium]
MHTQVAIIGGGPAGLLLGQLLHQAGIDNIIVERQAREYVLARIRAGVLEQGTVNLLKKIGVSTRLEKEGLIHHGFQIAFQDESLHINLTNLTNGKNVTVYGQTEVTKDLVEARAKEKLLTVYEADEVTLHDLEEKRQKVTYFHQDNKHEISCDFIAGCDGYHGVSRSSIPQSAIKEFERIYPFGWLGLLSDTPPVDPELIYGKHVDGFYLCSMRSMTRSRYYIQCALNEDINQWSDDRFWDSLRKRLPTDLQMNLVTGPSIEKSLAPLRSYVVEPLRFGNLFLVGDAAHIVPPTGAKGLNLAASDAHYLSEALIEYFHKNSNAGIKQYSSQALSRIWKAERFSWGLTNLLHRFPGQTGFDQKMQEAEFSYLKSSENARRVLAENYVGLPY